MIQPIGYLKLHRELYHKPIWKQSTPEQKVVLMTLLAMAWFNPNEWEWKGQKFQTVPGQFITSLESIVIDCGKGISIQNVRSSLKRFEKLGFLTNESTKTGRLVTIANWSVYQPKEDDPTKLSTKTQQRGNKEVTPKEEGNKEITKEKIYRKFKHLSLTVVEKDKILTDGYTIEQLDNVLNDIENYAKNKSYTSLNLTARKWLKKEPKLNQQTKSVDDVPQWVKDKMESER